MRGLINNMRFDEVTGCWNWQGSKNSTGYGRTWYGGRLVLVQRLAAHFWKRFDLKSKMWVLHKCDNRRCFNPKHLFLGTNSDIINDCVKKGRHFCANKKFCPHGHAYTPEITYVDTDKHRRCKVCLANRRSSEEMRSKRRAKYVERMQALRDTFSEKAPQISR